MSKSSACNGVFPVMLFAALLAISVSMAFADDVRSPVAQDVSAGRAQGAPTKPARVKRLTAPPREPRYKCEDGECVCKGVLDCKSLIDSGFCKGKNFWQDADDPSVGGCG